MSKPDATGESLESILASIRRSLAEQATDVLGDGSAAQADTQYDPTLIAPGEGDVPRLFGGAGTDPAQVEAALAGELGRKPQEPAPPSLGDVVPARNVAPAPPIEEPPPPVPASLTAASAPAPQDPFWFLSRKGEAAATKSGPQPAAPEPRVQAAPASAPPRPAEPKPARTEVVRGPLPPFFGSSAEAPKTEVMPVPPVPGSASVVPAAHIVEAPPPPREVVIESAPRHTPAPVATPVHMVTPAPVVSPIAAPRDVAPANGKLPPLFGPAPADTKPAAADGSAQIKGLEAMVAELLRPMLRRWLDENMPRLVSAALKAEAENIAKRDPKKT